MQIVQNIEPSFCRLFLVRLIYAAGSLVKNCLPGIWVMLIWQDSLTLHGQEAAVPDVKKLCLQGQTNTDIIRPRDAAWRERRKCFLYYSRRELPFCKYLSLPDSQLKIYNVSTQIWFAKDIKWAAYPVYYLLFGLEKSYACVNCFINISCLYHWMLNVQMNIFGWRMTRNNNVILYLIELHVPWQLQLFLTRTGTKASRTILVSYGLGKYVSEQPGVFMMASLNGNIIRVTGHLCGEFTGRRWIPRTKASDTELWYFFDRHLNKRLS